MERDQGMGTVRGARRRAGVIALALAALVAPACGGDDDGGTSGVDGDKRLDELSPAETTDLCEWGFSLLEDDDDLVRFGCYFAALIFSPDSETCEATAQECIDEAEPIDFGDAECQFEDLPACASEVSVAEMEACGRDAVAVLRAIADDISCDSDPDEIEDDSLVQPASCVAVEEKCPELFDDPDEDEGEATTGGSRAAIRWVRGAGRAARMVGAANAGL
jgi:hypothetical protein